MVQLALARTLDSSEEKIVIYTVKALRHAASLQHDQDQAGRSRKVNADTLAEKGGASCVGEVRSGQNPPLAPAGAHSTLTYHSIIPDAQTEIAMLSALIPREMRQDRCIAIDSHHSSLPIAL